MQLVTHNGRFHYDELLASAMLKRIYPNARIVRSRDNAVISAGDIVYDVGGVYDHSTGRYDHHQHTFNETFSESHNVKLSSCGLIYKHFHEKYFNSYNVDVKDDMYSKLVLRVYNDYILAADANDNGVNIYGDIKPRTIYGIAGSYNEYSDVLSDKQECNFQHALDFVSQDLHRYISNVLDNWFYKYKDLCAIIEQIDDYILCTDTYYSCDLILEVEKELKKNILYEIYPSDDMYKIRALNVDSKNFDIKVPLKKEWRGKRCDELRHMIDGATFVHASGFIGIHKTLEGAIEMCRISYNERVANK